MAKAFGRSNAQPEARREISPSLQEHMCDHLSSNREDPKDLAGRQVRTGIG